MLRLTRISIVSFCLGCGLTGIAAAQSVGMPAGREAATAPGGAIGKAGPRNRLEAIRSGDAFGRRQVRHTARRTARRPHRRHRR